MTEQLSIIERGLLFSFNRKAFLPTSVISNSALLRLDAQLCELGLLYPVAQAMEWSNDVRRNIVQTPTIASISSHLWKRSCCSSIARKIWLSIKSLLRKCSGKGERFFRLEGKPEVTCLKLSNEKVLNRCFLRIMWEAPFILFALFYLSCYEWAVEHNWTMFAPLFW